MTTEGPSGRLASPPSSRSSLRARLRVYAIGGLAVVAGWLYYTVTAVRTLYRVTISIETSTFLRERVGDARVGLNEAEGALERYTLSGEGFDLSRHHAGRTALTAALSTIGRRAMTPGDRGYLSRAESAAEVYGQAADRTIAMWRPERPAEARAELDTAVAPATDRLREALSDLEKRFLQSEANAEERLSESRDRATRALVIFAGLIVAGILLLVSDVTRRIIIPAAAAARALEDLAADREPPRLFDQSDDEIGRLGRHFNRAAQVHAERAQALAERDIESSVNAVLTVAATVNDLSGFGTKVQEKILEVSGASSAVLYLPQEDGSFAPAVSVGGAEAEGEIGREEARRAAREGRPLYLSVDPKSPTVNLLDGRILPRESAHIPLLYVDRVVGVLALGSTREFTAKARNALTAIAPSLAVALANAAANERVAEQSRRLAEQNELLEEQRSRIARTARELQQASALKDRFLASVSHELRTPMTVILGFTGALLRGGQGELTASQRESLERVQRNAKLLLALINDILDISKIEAGKVEIERQRVSLPHLFQQIEADHAEAARRKGLTLTAEVAPDLETVTTDPSKLTQILTNLVGNALKFTERGEVRLRAAARNAETWALTVSDTGIGIPEQEQEAIFEEFRQVESDSHRGRGGAGLGLAIVRKLALVLGGTVSVESIPGKGSVFTVLLPRELPEGGQMGSPLLPPVAAARRGDSKSVLIVDEDQEVRSP